MAGLSISFHSPEYAILWKTETWLFFMDKSYHCTPFWYIFKCIRSTYLKHNCYSSLKLWSNWTYCSVYFNIFSAWVVDNVGMTQEIRKHDNIMMDKMWLQNCMKTLTYLNVFLQCNDLHYSFWYNNYYIDEIPAAKPLDLPHFITTTVWQRKLVSISSNRI